MTGRHATLEHPTGWTKYLLYYHWCEPFGVKYTIVCSGIWWSKGSQIEYLRQKEGCRRPYSYCRKCAEWLRENKLAVAVERLLK